MFVHSVRFTVIAVAVAVAVAAASCASVPAADPPADPPAAPSAAPTPAQVFEPNDVREDLHALYVGLRKAHYNLYARTPKAEYDARFEETSARLNRPMTKLEVEREFQIFVAAGRIAHARIDYLLPAFRAHRASGGKTFPLAARIIGGKVFVSENASGVAAVASGDEVLAIADIPIGELLTRLRRHVSADTDYMSDSLVELDLDALLWLELGPLPSFRLSVKRPNGAAAEVELPARTREEMKAAAASMPAPLALDVTERVSRILPGGVAYLRPGIFMNLDEGADPFDPAAFHAFIDRSFAEYLQAGASALLIDLRDNPGGHNSFSDHMIAWFAVRPFRFYSELEVRASKQAIAANEARLAAGEPGRVVSQQLAEAYAKARAPGDLVKVETPLVEPRSAPRFKGSVFVLINRRAYSNSVAVAALIQDYRLGTILGEATSDLATTYGAMEQFTLPNTGIRVGYPKARIVRPSGDAAPQGVKPDLEIRTPIFEPADDPVLKQALRSIAERGR